MLKVGIVGICGRMGHVLVNCFMGLDGVKIVCGVDRNTNNLPLNCNVPVVSSFELLDIIPDVLIDFTRPDCSLETLNFARAHNIKVVLGTTGFDDNAKSLIKEASKEIAIVWAANFSVGINVLLSLIKKTASIMQDADIEIVEAHHRYKVDCPSGTAIAMGEAAALGRNVNLKDVMVSGRDGITGERQYGTIGFSSIRGGDVVGVHDVNFLCDGESVTLTHKASSRETFARGAIRAAMWLENKKAGLYSMKEVLDLDFK